MAAYSSAARASRPALLASWGSSARSGRPMACISRRKIASPLPPMMMWRPSRVVWVLDGVMPGITLPVRSRTKPATSNSGTMLSIIAKTAS